MKKLILLFTICLSSFLLKGQDTNYVGTTEVHGGSIIIQPNYQLFAPHTTIDSFLIIKEDTIYYFVNDTTSYATLTGKKYLPTLNFLTKYVAGHGSAGGGSDDSVHVKSTADTFLVNERIVFLKEDSSYIEAATGSNYGLRLYSGTSNIWLNNQSDKIYFRSDSGIYFAVDQTDANAYLYDGTYFRNNTDSLADLSTVRSLVATGGGAENDPIFSASPAFGITNNDITNWDNVADSAVDQLSTNAITDNGAGEVTITGTDFTTELSNDLTLYGSNITFGHTSTGLLQVNNTAKTFLFYDLRTSGNQRGIEYYSDYSDDFTSSSLVNKGYVSTMISDSATAGGWADNSGDTAKFNFLLSKNKPGGIITSNNNNLNVAASGLLELSGESANNILRLGTNLYYFYSPGNDPFTFYNGSYYYLQNGIIRTPSDTVAWLSDVRDLISSSSGITPGDNILDWDVINGYYKPYTTRYAGVFYNSVDNPINTNLLKYDGNFRASKIIGTNFNVGSITAVDNGTEFNINDNIYLQDNFVSRTIRGGEFQMKFNASSGTGFFEIANEVDGFGTLANRESFKMIDDTILMYFDNTKEYTFDKNGITLPDSTRLTTAGYTSMPTWLPSVPSILMQDTIADSTGHMTWLGLTPDVINTTWHPDTGLWSLLYNPVDSADNLQWVYMEEDTSSTIDSLYDENSGQWITDTIPNIIPAGSSGEIQYNNAGNFAGLSTLTTDGSVLTLDTTLFAKEVFAEDAQYNIHLAPYGMRNLDGTGYRNIGIGRFGLNNVISGDDNVALGWNVLYSVNSGKNNFGSGYYAMRNLTTGDNNIGIGYYVMYDLTTGSNNIGLGLQSMHNIREGSYNIAIGNNSLPDVYDGIGNIAIGVNSGTDLVDLNYRIFINSMVRGSTVADDTTESPIYIKQDAVTSDQEIYLNGNVHTKHNLVEGVGTIADNDATPDVTGASTWTYNGTANAVVITDLDNPIPGEYYTIIGNSDTYTITINDSGNFNTSGSIVLGADDVVTIYVQADNDYIQSSPVVDN